MSSSTTITAEGGGSSKSARTPDGPLRPGDLVGRYVVLARVGAGGMGIVYAAFDPELDRKVAVKLLHADEPSEARTRRQQRLLREARAMAKLDHPNVVTVHDVGAHGDRVYLAMEFVEGKTLAAWCLARARAWRQVVDVFVAAGRGLAAAHECGLVHRDFKPDNVMVGVGSRPRVRVMDFGLARAAASSADLSAASVGTQTLDATHQALAGTPAYMAPETLRRERVDAPADQFSFCVALWETLYGQHPFGGETPAELAGNVTSGRRRPPPPGRAVPRWIRRVCIRGLSPDPAQRFASMHALVAALERGHARVWTTRALAGVAILAAVGVGTAWFRGHRREQAVAACEAEGDAISSVWNEAKRLELHERTVGSGAPGADAAADRVMPWLDGHAERWATARTDACVRALDDPAWAAEIVDRSVWCLDDRKRQLDALVSTLVRGEPEGVSRAVQAAAELLPVDPCLDADFLERVPAPDPADRNDVAAVHDELFRAGALYGIGAYDEGLDVARAALARAEEIGWAPLTATARMHVGDLLEATGDYAEAERLLENAYFDAVNAAATDVAVLTARGLAYTLGYRLSRPKEAMRWWRQADALDRELPDPTGVRRGRGLAALAALHRLAGDYAAAREVDARAVSLLEVALGPEHPEVAGALTGMGNSHSHVGEYAEAREAYAKALAIFERTFGPEHPDVATALDSLGGATLSMGDIAEAIELRERSLRIREQVFGPDHPEVGLTLAHLASTYRELGEHTRALTMLERALAIQEKALGPDDIDVARALFNIAAVHQSAGEHERAAPLLERALEIAEKKLGPDHPETAHPLIGLAQVRRRLGETARARTMFERAVDLIERSSGPENPMLVVALEPLAAIALEEGRAGDAVALAERALALAAEHDEPEATTLASTRFLLARALAEAGREPERAESLAAAAREAYVAAGDDYADRVTDIDAWLATH